jgi:hypothetical protein
MPWWGIVAVCFLCFIVGLIAGSAGGRAKALEQMLAMQQLQQGTGRSGPRRQGGGSDD